MHDPWQAHTPLVPSWPLSWLLYTDLPAWPGNRCWNVRAAESKSPLQHPCGPLSKYWLDFFWRLKSSPDNLRQFMNCWTPPPHVFYFARAFPYPVVLLNSHSVSIGNFHKLYYTFCSSSSSRLCHLWGFFLSFCCSSACRYREPSRPGTHVIIPLTSTKH